MMVARTESNHKALKILNIALIGRCAWYGQSLGSENISSMDEHPLTRRVLGKVQA